MWVRTQGTPSHLPELASGQAKSAHCTEVPSLRFPAKGVAWKMVAGIPDKIRRPDQTLLAESSRGRRATGRASGRPGRARQEGGAQADQARGMRGAGTADRADMLQTSADMQTWEPDGGTTPRPNQSPFVFVLCLSVGLVVPACSILVPDSPPSPSSNSLTQFCCTTVRTAPSYSLRMNELSLLSFPPSAHPLLLPVTSLSLIDLTLYTDHVSFLQPCNSDPTAPTAHVTAAALPRCTPPCSVLFSFSAGPTSQGRLQASDCDASIGRHQSGKAGITTKVQPHSKYPTFHRIFPAPSSSLTRP